MKNYEVFCILNPRLSEDKVKEVLEKTEKRITQNEGEAVKANKQGIRRLPFTFSKHKRLKEGLYLTIDFKGSGKTAESLKGFLRLQEDIVRYMVTIKGQVPAELEAQIVPEEEERAPEISIPEAPPEEEKSG